MPAVQQPVHKSGDIAKALLAHYDRHARVLPWRKPPGKGFANPYHVWLSEIMLQQTTVAAVGSYFHKFTQIWPDFAALAAADDADVMAAWAGLGYYARARNLLKCARVVVAEHDGRLPETEAELLKLPGIGPYTAAAIAAIAFGKRAVVVDANVERVVSRLFAISTPLPQSKPLIREATESITPDNRAGDFAQAMMDLGAGICSVRAPSCLVCPVAFACDALRVGNPEVYPAKMPKAPKPQRAGRIYWIERDDHVWLVRRHDNGLLAGMRALPDDRWTARLDGHATPPAPAEWRKLPVQVSHVFTHFSLLLDIAVTSWPAGTSDPGEGEWWPLKSLDKAGLPTVFRKAAEAVINAGEKV
ncbi:A/G-specific adenine glycosylase [Sphingorhabdus sp.]|uniref:A/G-specific adenine glycosylase n=1 Tax=Sphingorhabdus sp. TaxID=1902408 RepID=UPI00391DDD7B